MGGTKPSGVDCSLYLFLSLGKYSFQKLQPFKSKYHTQEVSVAFYYAANANVSVYPIPSWEF